MRAHPWTEPLAALLLFLGSGAWAAEANQPRGKSAEIHAAIRTGLPKYQPKPAETRDETAAANEVPIEKNGMLYLPKVTVRSKGLPGLTEYEMMTPKGRLELAKKRYPGIKIGNLFGLNDGIASFMLQEEIEAAKKDDLKDQVSRVSFGDSPETKQTNRLLKDSLQRPDSHWAGGARP